MHDGQIAIREYLHLTVSFDHDVVDGAPAARFVRRFTELVETAVVLEDGSGGSGLMARPDSGADAG